jgi:CHAT domain-containing protein
MADAQRLQSSRELFQALFPPAARDAIARADRLVLSPDGALWDLPFAALVTNASGRPTYLGLEKPLSYTQSLTALAQSARRSSSVASEMIIVGNPLYEHPAPSAPARASRVTGERAMVSAAGEVPPPLPFAEQEAKQIASLYKTRASIGAEPTEAWFRERAGRARVIHLATHGYFNPSRAVSSGVWLAVPGVAPQPSGTNDDGTLQAWEVLADLRLQADLVILSACETGVGAKIPGEGLIGLTRAFQVAGAASVVATQWKVADRSTSQAMVEFHRRLLAGGTRGEALFEALKAIAADRATEHPYHWAPFVLVGDFGLGR